MTKAYVVQIHRMEYGWNKNGSRSSQAKTRMACNVARNVSSVGEAIEVRGSRLEATNEEATSWTAKQFDQLERDLRNQRRSARVKWSRRMPSSTVIEHVPRQSLSRATMPQNIESQRRKHDTYRQIASQQWPWCPTYHHAYSQRS